MAPDAFQQELARYGQDPSQQAAAPTPQPVQPQAHGNWFTHLLPTIGGIGGSILGGIATAGLGGEVAGGAGGAGLGKALENALEGQKVLQGNDVSAAVEGGMGAGIGGAAGKVLGKAGEYLGGRAANLTKAADEAGAVQARATALKDINPTLQSNLKANDSLDHVTNMGFDETNPTHVQQVGQTTNDILNDSLNSALSAHGPIDASGYTDTIKNILSQNKYKNVLGDMQPVAIAKGRLGMPNNDAVSLYKQLAGLGDNVATNQADPIALRQLSGDLYKTAQDAKPTLNAQGVVGAPERAKYNAINDVRNEVLKLIDNPEVNTHLQNIPANITAEDVGGSQQLADHINNILSTAGQNGQSAYRDITGNIAKNINIKDLGDEMARVRQIGSSTGAQGRAMGDVPTDGSQPGVTSVAHDAATSGGHPVTMLAKFAAHSKDNPKILNTLSRVADIASKGAAPAGAGIGAANASIQDANGTMGGTMPPLQTDPSQQSPLGAATAPQGGLSREDLLTLALYSPSAFSSLTTPSAANQQTVAAANTAEQALSGLGPAPGGGILSQIQGHLGLGGTGEYQRKAANAAQEIATALPGANAGTIEKELTNYNAGSGNIDQAIKELLANLEATKQNNTNGAYQQLMNYHPSVLSQVPVGA